MGIGKVQDTILSTFIEYPKPVSVSILITVSISILSVQYRDENTSVFTLHRRPGLLDSEISCSCPQPLCGTTSPGRSFFSGPAKPGVGIRICFLLMSN